MLIRRHLQAYDTGRVAAHVDDHALDRRNDAVAGEWILPGAELGVTDPRVDEIHLAHVALILLKRGDLLRIGRPDEDGAVAARPTGVVGRVTEVLDAIAGQLDLAIGRDIAHPQIPITNECGAIAVGGQRLRRAISGAAPSASAAAATTTARIGAIVRGGALRRFDVARDRASADGDADHAAVGHELELRARLAHGVGRRLRRRGD